MRQPPKTPPIHEKSSLLARLQARPARATDAVRPKPESKTDRAPDGVAKTGRRSGSERRRRKGPPVQFRVDENERAALDYKARAKGLTVGAYARLVILGDAGPRARHAPDFNRQMLADAMIDLNRLGNNVNQIARRLNSSEAYDAQRAEEVYRELGETMARIRAAFAFAGKP